MNFDAENYEPEQDQRSKLLPMNPNHPFFLWYKPTQNLFVYLDVPDEKNAGKGVQKTKKKGFFVPHLRMERIASGVNGVKQIKGEIGDPAPRMIQLQKMGCIILRPEDHDYIRRYRTQKGPYFHTLRFQTLRFKANKVIREMDKEGYQKWAISLMVEKKLSEFEPAFLEALIAKKERIPEKYIKTQHLPEVKSHLDAIYKEIKDMKAFVSEWQKKGIKIFEDIV